MTELQPALDAALDALEGLGLRYAVVGGLAVGAWGVPRATKDVDLYAELPTTVRPRVRREFAQRNFDVPAMDEELERFGVFRSLFRPTTVFVDIFDAENPLGEAILSAGARFRYRGGYGGRPPRRISRSSRHSPIVPGTTKT